MGRWIDADALPRHGKRGGLVRRMDEYCVGYDEVEYNGKWYYTVHHA